MMMRTALALLLLLSIPLRAQDDPVARARQLAAAGERAQAIALLEARLAEHPDDRDARTLYGTVLSWNGDYDRARAELQRVLTADPGNADARTALENVLRWSRLQPARREAIAGADFDDLPGDSWTQLYAMLRVGSVIGRASHAERGNADDQQFELEAWPRLRGRAYAYVAGGVSTNGVLYPDWRLAAELYQPLSRGFEVSAGYRRLEFDDAADIYTLSAGRYAGPWFFQGRALQANGELNWQALARRYLNDAGSYVGLRAGAAREEIRSGTDLIALDRNDVAVEGRWVSPSRWSLTGRAGVSVDDDDGAFTAGVAVGRGF